MAVHKLQYRFLPHYTMYNYFMVPTPAPPPHTRYLKTLFRRIEIRMDGVTFCRTHKPYGRLKSFKCGGPYYYYGCCSSIILYIFKRPIAFFSCWKRRGRRHYFRFRVKREIHRFYRVFFPRKRYPIDNRSVGFRFQNMLSSRCAKKCLFLNFSTVFPTTAEHWRKVAAKIRQNVRNTDICLFFSL